MNILISAIAKELSLILAGGCYISFLSRRSRIPCNSCDNLVLKGGGGFWKYTCRIPGREFDDNFDAPPKYCKHYKNRTKPTTGVDDIRDEQLIRVVKCRNCKFWTKQEDSLQGRCELFGSYPTGGWFCANGRMT